jgi:hypothetical protein
MDIKEIKQISKLIPRFVMMCENDLDEAEYPIKNPLTYEEYEKIQKLIIKLKNCDNYVNSNIFK